MVQIDSVMILAAGFGKRLKPLTDHQPKPLVQVAGVPILAKILTNIKNHSEGGGENNRIKQVIINSHYLAPQLDAYMRGDGAKILGDIPYHIIYEPTILETGGAVKNALPLLNDKLGDKLDDKPFFVINGDGFWDGDDLLQTLADGFAPATMAAYLAVVSQKKVIATSVGLGDFAINPDGKLQRSKDSGAMIFSGVQVLTPALFAGIDEQVFSLNAIYDRAIENQSLYGMAMTGRFFTIGTAEDVKLAEATQDD